MGTPVAEVSLEAPTVVLPARAVSAGAQGSVWLWEVLGSSLERVGIWESEQQPCVQQSQEAEV